MTSEWECERRAIATTLRHFEFAEFGGAEHHPFEIVDGVALLAHKFRELKREKEIATNSKESSCDGLEVLFEDGPVRAFRWDTESAQWRRRGEGRVSVSYHLSRALAKLVFVDAKLDAQRLLQWIDGAVPCKVVNGDCVEWEGADHTMYDRLKIVMVGRWRLRGMGGRRSYDVR